MKPRWRLVVGLGLLTLMIGMVPVVGAQQNVILQLAVPQFMLETFTDEVLAPFEQQYGVQVQVVDGGTQTFFPTSAASDVTAHLEAIADYVSAADVVVATNDTVTVEATRAGYYLDLMPLANGDATLNVDDFYPALYQSFQWDRGLWALPISTSLNTLTYDQAAFDALGLAYPDPRWTLDDLAYAARQLTERDPSGTVTVPGLLVSNADGVALLMRSLLGQGFYDMNALPEAPMLATPQLEALLTSWQEMVDEGIVTVGFQEGANDLPMTIGTGFFGGGGPNNQQDTRVNAILPGGHAELDTQGVAVSKGTLYPELAYDLAKFLTSSPEATNNPFGLRPARVSMLGIQSSDTNNVPGGGFRFRNLNAATDALLDEALPTGLGSSEMRFSAYVAQAIQSMSSDGLDATTALQDAEANAVANLQTAADTGANTVITVAAPEMPVVLTAGEIALNFGYSSLFRLGGLPNEDQWQALIDEFVANDPQVGEINMDAGGDPRISGQDDAALYDCFILPTNSVSDMDLTTILNLDPYLNSDPNFDPNDMVSGVLAQVQQDNKTWALPLTLSPQVMEYDPQAFARAGVPEPLGGWTVDEFVNALEALKVYPEDPTPFAPQDSGTSLLMLIAAYGGTPLDYRTNPPTANFTDPATVDAIRQVLDLAKAGYIAYDSQQGGGFVVILGGGGSDIAPIRTQSFGGRGQGFGRGGGGGGGTATTTSDDYLITTYPTGLQYNAVSYSMYTAYISASAENPDACYRWISTIAQNSTVIGGMPAQRSAINDPTLLANEGQATVDAYLEFDRLLGDPNTITLVSLTTGASPSSFVLNLWLNQVFDDYVLNNGDLDADLAQAQIYADGYLECVAALPPVDVASNDPRAGFQQIAECATKVDPNFTSLIGFGGGGGGGG
ncbi:MAG: extracellular solute-binding protein [Anaerolineaceae bacterium]|nr:extracellular solute-binding protein [Anaerolineaceae bacterium]